jgi:hypothetical protein
MKTGVITDEHNLVGLHCKFQVTQETSKAHDVHAALRQDAIESACAEFKRAHQIDPPYVILSAYNAKIVSCIHFLGFSLSREPSKRFRNQIYRADEIFGALDNIQE